MGDIKLFRTDDGDVTELKGQSVALEKSLQSLIESNLEIFLGIQFLASEYSTGKKHGGRIDTLGLDENGCPCIIEYKRTTNENVINQGLYYLDWLMDHCGEFELLVMNKLGEERSKQIEWDNPRLLCIAGDFNKFDAHAVGQINRNIELLRYVRYGENFLILDLLNAVTQTTAKKTSTELPATESIESLPPKVSNQSRSVEDQLAKCSPELTEILQSLEDYCLTLGDDIQKKLLKWYIAFKRIKNFTCIEIQYAQDRCLLYLKVDPSTVELKEGWARDVTQIGHYGTGDLELTITSMADLEKALPLIAQSYDLA